ncbi:LytR/AlgR family response regulator transcription factor [Heyndrickxia ginsengihumi]|uniref:LytR/AlgR family response regulator transcription factor n=1 Tax=Heyndrickxia ginsengihumi TaxID=363870 RepID=UPI003D21D064
MRVILADDDQQSLETVRDFLKDITNIEIVAQCQNSEELVETVIRQKPDILLVDVQMSKKNGMDAVKECLMFHPQVKLIFICAQHDHALEAFQMNAIDYIVKPVGKNRLYQAIEKAITIIMYERKESPKIIIKHLPIKDLHGISYIPQQDILFIEKSGKKCLIYTEDNVIETNENIGTLLNKLDDSFFPAHRSYIINFKKIKRIVPKNETYLAYFDHIDQQASISKLKINEVKDKISQFMKSL